MARNMYGATSADFTLTAGGRIVPGATLTIWSARTGGTQITDLTDVAGTAITSVTSGADGSVVYYGPDADKDTHWAQASQGSRIAIRPVNITGETGATPALTVGTVTTGTAAATLTGTDEDPVLNLVLPSAGANGVNTAAIQDGAVTAAKIGALTTKGDLLARDASTAVRLPVGTDGQVLVADAAAPAGVKWGAEPAVKAQIGNLLTANQASGTDTLGDTTGFAVAAGSPVLASSTAQAASGSRSLSWTTAGTGTEQVAGTPSPYAPADFLSVTPGTVVSAQVKVKSSAAEAFTISVYWYLAGAYVGFTASSAVTSSTSVWTTLQVTGVAPAGCDRMVVILQRESGAAGTVHYLDEIGLWRGADGLWVPPGLVVPGTSHIAVNGAYTTSGTVAPEGAVTAPPLSRYLQTSGAATVTGAMEWVKATGTGNTGWVAGAEADTELRDVSALIPAAHLTLDPNAKVWIRRVGSRVTVNYANGAAPTATGVQTIADNSTLPTGFRFTKYAASLRAVGIAFNSGTGAPGVSLYMASSSSIASATHVAATGYIGSITYTTDDAWPSSLPGVAA